MLGYTLLQNDRWLESDRFVDRRLCRPPEESIIYRGRM